jgi:hypothetical protein
MARPSAMGAPFVHQRAPGRCGHEERSLASATFVERTERGDQLFLAMATRHAHHAIDFDAAALITG